MGPADVPGKLLLSLGPIGSLEGLLETPASGPLMKGFSFGAAPAAGEAAENCPWPPAVKLGRPTNKSHVAYLLSSLHSSACVLNIVFLGDMQLLLRPS